MVKSKSKSKKMQSRECMPGYVNINKLDFREKMSTRDRKHLA